ncbi:uracil-DNA glycosylase family protein [Calditrichota bacterium]
MNNQLQKVTEFFEAQRLLYGKQLILSRKFNDNFEYNFDEQVTVSEANTVKENAEIGDLEKFHQQIKNCKLCELGSLRTNFVFGTGNPQAKIMFVGEAPGRDEDLQGKPFVGRAGQLLTMMLRAIGLKREDVFIANVLKCRPPNNRDPKPEEIEKCEPYLLKQIEYISPSLIVALGRFGASTLLRSNLALGEMRKKDHRYNDVPLIVTYHPAALLRNPQWKKPAWEDLKKIATYL